MSSAHLCASFCVVIHGLLTRGVILLIQFKNAAQITSEAPHSWVLWERGT